MGTLSVPWGPHCAMGTLSVPWGPFCAVGTPPCPSAPISPQNFLNSGSCPEVQGFLQLREAGRKVWKRFYFSLRRSGLYYSTKGTSKVRAQAGARPGGCGGAGPDSPPPPQDPRHLQYFADLTESNIYYVTQGKKHYGTPTEFGFCIKVGMSLLGWGPGVPVLPCAFPCQGISAPPKAIRGCPMTAPVSPHSPTRCGAA